MIHTIFDACQEVLEINGEPQSPYWLASQMEEMRLWKASEQKVRAALEKDIREFAEQSRFVKVADDEWALRSWEMESAGDEGTPRLATVPGRGFSYPRLLAENAKTAKNGRFRKPP